MTKPKEVEPEVKQRHRISVVDAVIAVFILIFVLFLAKSLLDQLSLRHEVSSAKTVTNSVITDFKNQDAAGALKLGDATFKAEHTQAQLQNLFKTTNPYLVGPPTVVKQTVANGATASGVGIVYKYGSQHPFYVQVIVRKTKQGNVWQLYSVSGNASEANY
jgi:hypothetical protein